MAHFPTVGPQSKRLKKSLLRCHFVKRTPTLVPTPREQRRQNHQIPGSEEPLARLVAIRLHDSYSQAQPVTFCKVFQMLRTNSGKVRDLN
jgi:hypothetical protein